MPRRFLLMRISSDFGAQGFNIDPAQFSSLLQTDDRLKPLLVVRIISHSLASRRFAAGNVVYRTLVGYALGLLAIVLEQE